MRLPGRIAAAIDVLAEIEDRHRPASEALKDWGLSHRYAGSGDRSAVGDLVYDALRRRASIAFRMGEETPRALALGTAVFEWGETAEKLNQMFSEDRHAPEAIRESECERLESASEEGAPDWVRADVPQWAAASFEAAFGEAWVEEAAALGSRPPLDLRVNLLKTDRDKVAGQLSRFDVAPTRFSPVGLRIAAVAGARRNANVTADEAYRRGRVEVQDEASQLAALMAASACAEIAGEAAQMLDLCAGGGGKTLALSAAQGNRGQVFAHDVNRSRLAPIYERLKRAEARNVQVRAPGEGALADLEGRMDLVLVDAPCSGSGTWRRRPDAKWRMRADALDARMGEQDTVLAEAARYVKPGGRLVYVTCSLFATENEDRAAAFTAAQPEFSRIDPAPLWEKVTGAAPPRWTAPGSLTLTPASTATDGFFFAAFARG
ncbi:RsmB/NOP family class I SAM-dependent RNA methyltransferase [Afifella sp. IM 167]|uniref:RsmB/NOP family class I SAM-dependent RNA methyltransferase n=1 Tax=Afifella sp. IM 167 TaxID=2033586 RepID=UPI001CCACCCD|nr:RsmB/NOP family class I SAM-dependent RNA methyltransferase [Afifella sp. IM 167]MBZ8134409.1 MFS transporter [Afifella sp. IM 167]